MSKLCVIYRSDTIMTRTLIITSLLTFSVPEKYCVKSYIGASMALFILDNELM